MLIAEKLKKENIAEYMLYMWQIEDLIRAHDLNIEKIEEQIISRFNQPDNIKEQLKEWYANLIQMMRSENIVESGHLAINQYVIEELTQLHKEALKSPEETEYTETYYKTLPFIVELRSKSPNKNTPELETCFSALYGFLLMRLQQKEISGETQAAISQISTLLRLLSQKYKKDIDTKQS